MMQRILLLSAYDAPSHRSWREGLTQSVSAEWTVWTLPARHYSWRIRGNALSWFQSLRKLLNEQEFDGLICTSMVDLSTLRGLCPALVRIPTLVYFHENQAAYPRRSGKMDAADVITNAYTALAADRVLFNTEFNRESFLSGLGELFQKLPDGVPSGIVASIFEKSGVLPVGIHLIKPAARQEHKRSSIHLVWNHRWEYDKGPERLFCAMNALERRGVSYEIDILGQQFRQIPEVFDTIKEVFSHRIRRWGYVARADYEEALKQADFVLSTALHEFQGLAVLEAMSAGCIPVVPDRLAYRETVPDAFRYASHLSSEEDEAEALVDLLMCHAANPPQIRNRLNWVDRFSWTKLGPLYQEVLVELRLK